MEVDEEKARLEAEAEELAGMEMTEEIEHRLNDVCVSPLYYVWCICTVSGLHAEMH